VKKSRVKPEAVVQALKAGGVVMPLLGGYCVLGLEPEEIKKRLGAVYRLVTDRAGGVVPSAEIEEVLKLPVVAITSDGTGWAKTFDPLAQKVLNQAGRSLWFGLPEEGQELSGLIEELDGWLKLVVVEAEGRGLGKENSQAQTIGQSGFGPAVIDFGNEPATILRKGGLGIMRLERLLRKRVRLGPGVFFSVLVVCTGNSCRSPIAAGLLSAQVKGMPVLVSSAGIAAPVGRLATGFAIAVAQEMGVDITSHRSRQINQEMVTQADLILVMEEGHRKWILEMAPEADAKIRLLGGYPDREEEIPDPIGRSIEFYRQSALLIKAGVLKVVAEIKERV